MTNARVEAGFETNGPAGRLSVGELVRQRHEGFSPAERKLARALLALYPTAGLESVGRFADRAGVSPPSVTRFIAKLGFRGYPEFQAALRSEVQERLSSPLARYEDHPDPGSLPALLAAARESLESSTATLSRAEFEAVVRLLADDRRRVFVLGGRVSSGLARYLAGQLHLLRPGVTLVDAERHTPVHQLVDLHRRDVLITFDFRRYQSDTIEAARVAAQAGCQVVIFTDPWLSPAAASATHVLVAGVATIGPFDSRVGALAVAEALVAALLDRLGPQAARRMSRLEDLGRGDVLAAGG